MVAPLILAGVVTGVVEGFIALDEPADPELLRRMLERDQARYEAACAAGEFAKLALPTGLTQDDVERLTRAAQSAVDATPFQTCDCDVETVRAPWDGVDVFRITHGSGMTTTVRDIAVDRSGHTWPLTAVLAGGEDSAKEALRSFEALGETRNVWLEDAAQARDYLGFVLRAFREEGRGLSLPGEEVADHLATLAWNSPEAIQLEGALQAKEPERPHVEILAENERGWAARAFTWQSRYGLLDVYQLSVSKRGRVAVRQDRYGSQAQK